MKGKKGTDKAYSIRPALKDKFRPQEAKEKIEKIVKEKLENKEISPKDFDQWTAEISETCKEALKKLGKDKRYKFLVQCVICENLYQGVRVGSR